MFYFQGEHEGKLPVLLRRLVAAWWSRSGLLSAPVESPRPDEPPAAPPWGPRSRLASSKTSWHLAASYPEVELQCDLHVYTPDICCSWLPCLLLSGSLLSAKKDLCIHSIHSFFRKNCIRSSTPMEWTTIKHHLKGGCKWRQPESKPTHSGTTSEVDEDVHVDGWVQRQTVGEACREQDGDKLGEEQIWEKILQLRVPSSGPAWCQQKPGFSQCAGDRPRRAAGFGLSSTRWCLGLFAEMCLTLLPAAVVTASRVRTPATLGGAHFSRRVYYCRQLSQCRGAGALQEHVR